MKNKQRQKEIEEEIKRRKKCRINVGKKKENRCQRLWRKVSSQSILNVNNVFEDCTSAGRAFQEIIARGKKLFKDEDFL